MEKKKCSECGGPGYVAVSIACPTCGGDWEVLNDAGDVIECLNPRCFYGSVAAVADCPGCDIVVRRHWLRSRVVLRVVDNEVGYLNNPSLTTI